MTTDENLPSAALNSESDVALKNHFRDKMAGGEIVSTLTLKILSGVEGVIIAKSTGYEGVFIDMEHSSLDLHQVSQISQAALGWGVTPIVRSPTKEPFFVQRIVDGGALGVVIPHIRSVQDAQDCVNAAKFAPIGHRSATAGLSQVEMRPIPPKQMTAAVNQTTMVIPMIETLEALDAVEEIAAIPGVDSLLIGASDLSAEMGIAGEVSSPRIWDAFVKVSAACRKTGIFLGAGGVNSSPNLMERLAVEGVVDWYLAAGDQGLLYGAAKTRGDLMKDINRKRMEKAKN